MRRKTFWGIVGVVFLVSLGVVFFLFSRKTEKFSVVQNGIADEASGVPRESETDGEKIDASNEGAPPSEIKETQNSDSENAHMNTKPAEIQQEEVKKNSSAQVEVNNVKTDFVSWGFEKANDRRVDTIIVHSSYNSLGGAKYDPEKVIAIYKEYEVSPHYLIDRDGHVLQLVSEKNIAYHAGISKLPDGRTNVNAVSVGIEMLNDDAGDSCTDKQYAALSVLIADIKKRYDMRYVLGHNDIAPGRKTDPWNFDWGRVKK